MGRAEENTGLIFLFIGLGGIGAYFTNFQGFKEWVDTYILPAPSIIGGDGDDDEGEFEEEFKEPKKVVKPAPPRVTAFTCVSYPRCNTVTGSTARKECCCNNKCSLLKKSNQTMSPRLSGNLCLCNFKTKTVTPPKCTGPCPLGKRPALVNGRCTCANCTNTCGSCYDRIANCACKLNTNKLTHSDTYCKSTCGGYSCWTNYPCPNRGARAQKCVKGTCAQARAAWIAAYSCKSSLARAHNATTYNNYAQVPTVA